MNTTLGLPNDGQEAVTKVRPTNSLHLIMVFIPLEFQFLGNQLSRHPETCSYSSNHVAVASEDDRRILVYQLVHPVESLYSFTW